MNVLHKKRTVIGYILVIAMAVFSVLAVFIPQNTSVAQAVESEMQTVLSVNDLMFTLTADSNGDESYKVAIKSTSRPTATRIIVPETYNGKRVTEIADGAFLSCAKLEKVILPLSIEKIGTNAFMNCAKLEQVVIPPRVKALGASAFGMCAALTNLYIPNSVETVGANLLRNNTKDVYVQASSIGDGWSINWNDYHTGKVYTNTDPSDMSTYYEMKDANGNVIGYELHSLGVAALDTVIYSSFSPDPENIEYKPVLNIAPGAFTLAVANSITIKHNPNLPQFNHAINICSQAFAYSFVDEIRIEVATTYEHPQGLTNYEGNPFESLFDYSIIEGTANGKAQKVFYQSTAQNIVLSDMDIVTDYMFADCAYLQAIKTLENENDAQNCIPAVDSIGDYAFSACISLENIQIPDTVLVGENIFDGWGDGAVCPDGRQSIYFDTYEDETSDWNSAWGNGINREKVEITYKQPVTITLHLQDGTETTDTVQVKPGNIMPAKNVPVRNGYEFMGYYAEPDGKGLQYYTNTMESARIWNDGDPTDLYAYWTQGTFPIEYVVDLKGLTNPNPTEYKSGDIFDFIPLQKDGYTFAWNIAGITADMTGNVTVVGTWTAIEYDLTYIVIDGWKGLTNSNPAKYTVENLPLTFIKLSAEGFTFAWTPASLDVGTLGPQEIVGHWTPNDVFVSYHANGGEGVPITKEQKYGTDHTVLPETTFTKTGYHIACWQTESGVFTPGVGTSAAGKQFALGTTDKIQNFGNELFAVWEPNTIERIFDANGGNGTRTANGAYDNVFAMPDSTAFTRTGYHVEKWQSQAGTFTAGIGTSNAGTQYELDASVLAQNMPSPLYAVWKPNTVTITFNANGGSGSATQQGAYDNDITLRNGSGFDLTGYYVEKWQTLPGTFTAGVGTSAAGIQYNFGTTDLVQNFATPLYAVWKPETRTITFDANSGSGTTSRSAKYDNSITLLSSGFYRTGYYLEKWQSNSGSFTAGVGTSASGSQYSLSSSGLVQNFPSTVYAVWKPITYTVRLHANNGSGATRDITFTYDNGQYLPIEPFENYGSKFMGWSTSTSGSVSYSDGERISNKQTIQGGVYNLYAQWKAVQYTVGVRGVFGESGSSVYYDHKDMVWGQSWEIDGAWGENGSNEFLYWEEYEYPDKNSNGQLIKTIYDKKITLKNLRDYDTIIFYYAYFKEIPNSGGGCVATGTQITLADGSQKAVEDLTGDEMLLVWNTFTGKFDTAPILFIDSEPLAEYSVTQLFFSDGTNVKVIYEHGFWDVTRNRYVYIRDGEATQYIGDWFNKQTTDANGNLAWTTVQLVDVKTFTEQTQAWSPVTYAHLNYYVNGMLSMPGGIEGLFNIFEVDAETLKYDEEAMQADIGEYGLYTYEEFAETYPIPEEMFDACGGRYLKVAIGKGLLTHEKLGAMIERYAKFFA